MATIKCETLAKTWDFYLTKIISLILLRSIIANNKTMMDQLKKAYLKYLISDL